MISKAINHVFDHVEVVVRVKLTGLFLFTGTEEEVGRKSVSP